MLPLSAQHGHSFAYCSGLEVNEHAEAFSHKRITKTSQSNMDLFRRTLTCAVYTNDS